MLTVLLMSATVLTACSDDDGSSDDPTTDAGMDTATTTDTGGGTTDTGMVDTGMTDTGMTDTGMTDTDMPDTDMPDTDMPDTDMPDGGPIEERVVCDNPVMPPPAEGVCDVSGSDPELSSHILIQGTVLAPDAVYEQGQVLVLKGDPNATIACVGCDCQAQAPEATTLIQCPEGVISPGLINAHDHLRFSVSRPDLPPNGERFDHRHDWREGRRNHTELDSSSSNARAGLLWGEVRMLLGGATSIAGSTFNTSAQDLLRNLDVSDQNGGLGNWAARYETFPLDDTSGVFQVGNCDYNIDSDSVLNNRVYLPHIAEGIDREAQNEFRCLSSNEGGGTDLVEDNTSVIHGIALTPFDIALMAADGAELVWSARTNIQLYGHTAPVVTYKNLGVTIALGTDWSASGSINVLRELQCFDYLNQNHYNATFTDRELWEMATINGAQALGGGDLLGQLAQDYVADITIFDGREHQDFRAVIDAELEDVVLVMRGGEPLHGDAAVVAKLVPG
ncbi:MAG: amidohydrolase family protein, partial [Myxococcota bacterium]